MNKKIRWAFLLALISLGWFGFESKSFATAPEFSVKAILTENQRDVSSSYFDLVLEPGATEELQVEITNSSERELTVELQATTAVTNINGLIDYSIDVEEPDDSLKINFKEIANIVENEITIPSGETKTMKASVNLPKQQLFDGILLGGLTVSEKGSSNNPSETENQITNRFIYSIAVMIAQNEEVVQPDLSLKSVDVEQRNRRNFIVGTIQNRASTIVNHFDVEATVFREGQDVPLFHEETLDMRMAPNSTLSYGIGTNNQPLSAGTYEMHMKATNGEEQWEWIESFTITSEKARKMNTSAVELEKDNTKLYLMIAGVVIFILVIFILLLMNREKIFSKKNDLE